MTVLVSVVTRNEIWADTCRWLLDCGYDVDIVATPLPLVHARNLAVRRFLESGHDYMYTLDADCVPAPNTIERLLAYGLDVVVSPHTCVVNGEVGVMACDRAVDGGYVQHHPMEGLQRVFAVGGSGVLVHRRVLEDIMPPWYMQEYDGLGQLQCSEDFYFSEKIWDAGYEIWADFGLIQAHRGMLWPM